MADNDESWRDPEPKGNESVALRDPWERRPDESDLAWRAFLAFRDSENRSLTEIARSSNFKCSVSNISRWCVLHNWRNRCFSYDQRRDEEERAQTARDRAAMRRRHLSLAVQMQAIGAHALAELRAKIASGTPLNLSPDEAKSMLDAGAKLERLTLGEGRESRYTKIVVHFGGYENEEQYEDALRGGGGMSLPEEGN